MKKYILHLCCHPETRKRRRDEKGKKRETIAQRRQKGKNKENMDETKSQ